MNASPLDGWNVETVGDTHWWAEPGLRDLLLGPDGLRLEEWLRDGRAVVVKTGPHRVVWRVELAEGHVVYVKHNRLPDVRAWLRQTVRPSKARIEFDHAVEIAARGIPTIEPLALGERQALFGACDSFLVTRGLDEAQTLNTFLAVTLAPMPNPRQVRIRQRLAQALGRFVARLHDAGVRHDDLHAANIMVRLTGDDRVQLFLIDLGAVHLKPRLDWRASRDNLVLLARWFVPRVTRADRLRFWRAYYEGRGLGIWPRGCHGHREHFALLREVEKHTLASALTFWKRRDPRCFGNNRYYRRVRRPGLVGHVVADFDAKELATLLADPDAPFGRPNARILKDSHGSNVIEIECLHGGVPRRLIYKRFRFTRWTAAWTSLVRPSAALRSWQFGHGLRERCLPTARPLLVLHRLQGGLPREGYMLFEKIENALDLHTFVAELAQLPASQARRRVRLAVDMVARAVRNLHRCRLSHRDLKAINLLIATDLERSLSPFVPVDPTVLGMPLASYLPLPASPVWFIDLAGVRLHARLPRSRRVQNLARLHASFHQSPQLTRTDKLRFLRVYLLWNLLGRGVWKTWWKAIDQATARKVARNNRHGRVLA